MDKEKMFIARDESGRESQYQMIMAKNIAGTPVIWYTDGTEEDGNKNIFISEYEKSGNTFMLKEITDEEKLNYYADLFISEQEK